MLAAQALNQGVIAQALHDIRHDKLRHCASMGFGESEWQAMKHPASVSILLKTTVSWCSVALNREVVSQLLAQDRSRDPESVIQPINQAVIAQALYDLRSGQLRHCKTLGFGEVELGALKDAASVTRLLHAPVPWCKVEVNRQVVQRLLTQVDDIDAETATIDRMLRLNASTDMIARFHGLSHQEVAVRREVLGLRKRKGRHRVLNEEQDAALWRNWTSMMDSRGVALGDDTAMLGLAMDLAETMSLPMSVVWTTIQGWIEEQLVSRRPNSKLRLRLSAVDALRPHSVTPPPDPASSRAQGRQVA